MNIDKAQEIYDNQNPYDKKVSLDYHEDELTKVQDKYDDLLAEYENAIERGDKYFDLYDLECKRANQLQEAYDSLTDRLRERDEEILRLTKLLTDNGIKSDLIDGMESQLRRVTGLDISLIVDSNQNVILRLPGATFDYAVHKMSRNQLFIALGNSVNSIIKESKLYKGLYKESHDKIAELTKKNELLKEYEIFYKMWSRRNE